MITNESGKRKFTIKGDGLTEDWKGYTFLNNPFSRPFPWIEKMVEHRNGIVLASAKSTETKWAQLIFSRCDLVYFLDDRIRFCYLDGIQSTGAWSPYLFAAFGRKAKISLLRLGRFYDGVMMTRIANAV
jgi:hypothetical protein